jgi:type VI protein secretion system component Hcp
MPTDAYVKFGKGTEKGGPANTELPYILGDSTDEQHWWWCELRSSGFGLTFPDQAKTDDQDDAQKEKATVVLDKVSLTKRVDWASTQLFLKCCEAGKAKVAKSQEEKDKGKIDQVTVEVCRTAGDNKFTFVQIEYYDVKIVHFAIDMDGPEPTETIEFEYDSFDFGYQKINPYTGEKDGNMLKATKIQGREGQAGASQTSDTSSGDGGGSTDGPSQGGNGSAAGAATQTPSDSPPPLVTPTDEGVAVNFPGLWQDTGFGVLPD